MWGKLPEDAGHIYKITSRYMPQAWFINKLVKLLSYTYNALDIGLRGYVTRCNTAAAKA